LRAWGKLSKVSLLHLEHPAPGKWNGSKYGSFWADRIFPHRPAFVMLDHAQGKNTLFSFESCSAWSAIKVVANGFDGEKK